MEKNLVTRSNVPFLPIPAAGLHGVGLLNTPGNIWKLIKGTFQSRQILRNFKPDVMFFTGGYVAVPMAIAGRKIPSLLYVPDIEPGLALKFLSRFANIVALTTQTSKQFFPVKTCTEISGYPTRPSLKTISSSDSRKQFGLQSKLPVLFVFGGSKGARSINQAIWKNLSELLETAEIIHITGSLDWPQIQSITTNLNSDQSSRYHPYPYLHEEMAAAFSCADLVISRAGASTLGELPLFGVPAILVPYPHAWRYQKVNADYLAEHGAAIVINDDDLAEDVLPKVKSLLQSPEKLSLMSKAAVSLANPRAAQNLADLLLSLAAKKQVNPC